MSDEFDKKDGLYFHMILSPEMAEIVKQAWTDDENFQLDCLRQLTELIKNRYENTKD